MENGKGVLCRRRRRCCRLHLNIFLVQPRGGSGSGGNVAVSLALHGDELGPETAAAVEGLL